MAERIEAARQAFTAALDDDLNISPALAALHELIGDLNKRELRAGDAARARAFVEAVDMVVGVLPHRSSDGADAGDEGTAGDEDDARVESLIQERNEARQNREFARADAIRDELKAQGIVLEDRPDWGTRWRREA